MNMKLDSYVFVDSDNNTLLTREPTFPLSSCAADHAALQERHRIPVFLYRSYIDESGKEVLAELATPLAKASQASHAAVTGVRVEIWHRTEPDFDKPPAEVVKADFTLAGVLLLPQADQAVTMLNSAYALSQNIEALWNPAKPARSTSVGDVLELQIGEAKQCFGVDSFGFCETAFV